MFFASPRWAACVLALLPFSPLVPTTARAQSAGFAIDRFDPAERGSDWFAADSLDMRGHGRLMLGATGDFSEKPLVLYNRDGDELKDIIKHQLFVHVGGSLVLWDRLRLGVNLPVLAYQAGENATVQGIRFKAAKGAAVGDLRGAVDVRLLGEYRSPFSLAAGVAVFAPTGKQEAFASDGKVRVLPRLLLAGDIGNLVYSAKLGVLYRAANDTGFNGSPQGTEAVVAAAIGYRSNDGKLVLGPELFGSTVVTSGNAFFSKRETPFELLFGAHYKVTDDVRLGAGVGPGLTRGFGAPQVRGLLSLEWAPEPKKEPLILRPVVPGDRDKDGILDRDDACPDEPGVKSDDPKKNGCPLPGDRDHDGILDVDDACPDVPGIKSDDPEKNGCPRPDTDKDGIFDDEDACVNDPGIRTTDPTTNGCPPPKDTDKDGIIDPEDACPEAPGPKDPDPKKNGCPAARIEQGQIKILERVEFENNSAKIRPESDRILNAVLALMNEHTEFTKLGVEGHTDNRGAAGHNLDLSRRRAASVMKWLTEHGVAAARLTSKGFGMTKPIDSNDSDAGRQNNRRVEFHILEKDGQPFSE